MKLGTFTLLSCSDGKEMYKKSDARTKLLFSQSQPIAFLPFSLPLPSLLIIGTLRSEDGDGSENVAEKVNSRSLNLHLREITVFTHMALADSNYYFCCVQLLVRDFSQSYRASEFLYPVHFGCKGTYFSNLSQSLSPYSRPPYISDRKQYEDLVDAYEN